MNIQDLKDITSLILQCLNLIIIVYGGYKFLNKPHDTLEQQQKELAKRVDAHDFVIKDIKESLHQGNDKFYDQEEVNATFKSVMLSFVNFEIAYCLHTDYKHTEELMKAKDELESYLAGKKRHEKSKDRD